MMMNDKVMVDINNRTSNLREKLQKIGRFRRYEVTEELGTNTPCLMGVEEDNHSTHSFCLAKASFVGSRDDLEYMAAADPETVQLLLDYIKFLERRVKI